MTIPRKGHKLQFQMVDLIPHPGKAIRCASCDMPITAKMHQMVISWKQNYYCRIPCAEKGKTPVAQA